MEAPGNSTCQYRENIEKISRNTSRLQKGGIFSPFVQKCEKKSRKKPVKSRIINNVRSEKRFSSFGAAILLQWRKKMKMPNKLILAVIKQPNSYNSWWYEVFSVDIFERTDNGFAGSLKNAEKDLSELHHGTEVRAFELVKENEYVHEGMSGCDCETYSLRGI